MADHDDVTRRLRALGSEPVDPELASAHLAAMTRADVTPRAVPVPRPFRTKLKVAGGFLAGLLIGGSGLAAADALPGPAQEVAHDVLAQVNIDVPPGKDRIPCDGVEYRNHGQYVRAQADKAAAAKQPCGKPRKSVEKTGGAGTAGETGGPSETKAPKGPNAAKGPKAAGAGGCGGPPPWSGGRGRTMTAEQKQAAQAEREATCGAEADADEPDDEVTGAGAATTTVPPTTTPQSTTTSSTTTTSTTTATSTPVEPPTTIP